ncbi:MAG: trypsin-like peptidase domain-containing protein, partial [Oscillospiraceae bacterium]|nr:trypsin-like peptidase domain-containing protein [Oscillospiraceae bacterium]
MNDNFENNEERYTAADECECFENTENEIINNIENDPVIEKKKRHMPVSVVFLVLIFIVVCVLTVYCIISDLSRGNFNSFESVHQGKNIVLHTSHKPGSDNHELTDENGKYTVEGLVQVVRPQVVEIYTYKTKETNIVSGSGSGIIITEDGYIVTNTHVLDGMEKYTVNTYDNKSYTAEIVGRDAKTDIAVIKINAKDLSAATLGNSDEVNQGEAVVAIGNPAGLTGSITDGIVSGLNRKIKTDAASFEMNCIQTNAAISPGNSGGALVNLYGQVIGITSSKYATVNSEGLGFAITINDALPIIEELISQGYVSGRVRVGITFYSSYGDYANIEFKEQYGFDIPEELEGSLWIDDISKDCDIANTELKTGDFIVSIEGRKVADYSELNQLLKGKKGGDKVKAECARVDKKGKINYFEIEFKLMTD